MLKHFRKRKISQSEKLKKMGATCWTAKRLSKKIEPILWYPDEKIQRYDITTKTQETQ